MLPAWLQILLAVVPTVVTVLTVVYQAGRIVGKVDGLVQRIEKAEENTERAHTRIDDFIFERAAK